MRLLVRTIRSPSSCIAAEAWRFEARLPYCCAVRVVRAIVSSACRFSAVRGCGGRCHGNGFYLSRAAMRGCAPHAISTAQRLAGRPQTSPNRPLLARCDSARCALTHPDERGRYRATLIRRSGRPVPGEPLPCYREFSPCSSAKQESDSRSPKLLKTRANLRAWMALPLEVSLLWACKRRKILVLATASAFFLGFVEPSWRPVRS